MPEQVKAWAASDKTLFSSQDAAQSYEDSLAMQLVAIKLLEVIGQGFNVISGLSDTASIIDVASRLASDITDAIGSVGATAASTLAARSKEDPRG